MYIFQKIEETTLNYTDARQAVGEFLLKERNHLNEYTVADIAEKTYTSKATVVRFAKAMGYSGWKEFITHYIIEVRQQVEIEGAVDYNFPIGESDDFNILTNNLKNLQIDTIHETIDMMNEQIIRKAVSIISNSKRVVIFADSPNIYFAKVFRRKMNSIGKHIEIATSGETGYTAMALRKEDCAIIVSYSGNNPSRFPTDKIEILNNNKVSLIGITSAGDNYIRNEIDCIISFASRERLYSKIGNFSTEESLNYIFNVLFLMIFQNDYENNMRLKINNSKKLEKSRHSSYSNMKEFEIHEN